MQPKKPSSPIWRYRSRGNSAFSSSSRMRGRISLRPNSRTSSRSAASSSVDVSMAAIAVVLLLELHPQQPRVHDLAEMIGTQRECPAAVECAPADEVEGADVGQLVAGDLAF